MKNSYKELLNRYQLEDFSNYKELMPNVQEGQLIEDNTLVKYSDNKYLFRIKHMFLSVGCILDDEFSVNWIITPKTIRCNNSIEAIHSCVDQLLRLNGFSKCHSQTDYTWSGRGHIKDNLKIEKKVDSEFTLTITSTVGTRTKTITEVIASPQAFIALMEDEFNTDLTGTFEVASVPISKSEVDRLYDSVISIMETLEDEELAKAFADYPDIFIPITNPRTPEEDFINKETLTKVLEIFKWIKLNREFTRDTLKGLSNLDLKNLLKTLTYSISKNMGVSTEFGEKYDCLSRDMTEEEADKLYSILLALQDIKMANESLRTIERPLTINDIDVEDELDKDWWFSR